MSVMTCLVCAHRDRPVSLPVHTPVRVPVRTPTCLCAPLSASLRGPALRAVGDRSRPASGPCRTAAFSRRRGLIQAVSAVLSLVTLQWQMATLSFQAPVLKTCMYLIPANLHRFCFHHCTLHIARIAHKVKLFSIWTNLIKIKLTHATLGSPAEPAALGGKHYPLPT